MATKAEAVRARTERERQRRKTKKVHARTDLARKRVEEEAAKYTSGRYAGGVTAQRNVKVDRGKHETRELEDSGSGRPSRKSTRKGANRVKPDSQLTRRAVRRARSPEARHASRGD